MAKVSPIPEGFQTLTAHIVCKDAAKAIDWYKRAFGAVEMQRFSMPDGQKIMHACLKIGNSLLMLADEFPDFKSLGPNSIGGTSVTMHLYVEDADATFNRAVQAGATTTMPMGDQFWGDRYGQVRDPFGHSWAIATHIKDMSPEELQKAGQEAMASIS